jgi:diacylglycerol kinase (ATP)
MNTGLGSRQRFLLLHNPAAGRNGIGLARAVVDELRRRGADVTFLELADGQEPDQDMVAAADVVIISGGDGSIRAIAEKLPSRRIPIGVIPNGTGNVLAEELALPKTAPEIADLLMRGPVHPIYGGLVNGGLFLLMFGAGFDGDVINELSRTWVQILGKLAYAAPIVRALLRKPRLFDIAIDGSMSRASWILVSNAAHYAGRFRLSTRTTLRDSTLVALISRATTRRQRLAELIRLLAGRLSASPTIEVRDVTHAEVLADDSVGQCDGEPLPPGRYVVRRHEQETLVIAPAPTHTVVNARRENGN